MRRGRRRRQGRCTGGATRILDTASATKDRAGEFSALRCGGTTFLSSIQLPRLRIVQGSSPNSPAFNGGPEWEPHLDRDGEACAYTRVVDGSGWLFLPGLASFRFPTEGGYIEALPESDAPADTITEAYYRVALPMALQATGVGVLHASAVSDARGVHVFCGASRSGKSTLAYALGRRGFEVWADDAVAFTVDGGEIAAIPLPFALRLRPDVAEFFDVPPRAGPQTHGKTETLRHQAADPREIATVSLLERGRTSTIARLSGREALPAVLYHSFYFSLDESSTVRRMGTQFLELIAEVSVFRISLRPGLDALADLLDALEQGVLAPAAA